MAGRPPEPAPPSEPVSAVVVTYRPDPEMLRTCLDSLLGSSGRPQELVIVDNSPDPAPVERLTRELVSAREATGVRVRLLPQARNLGYAAATNRGIRASSAELVLLLNPDARLAPLALRELTAAAASHPGFLGFAPKVLLSFPAPVIDSVGMSFGRGAEGSQRGLGQADAGQYDRPEVVAGLCFSAALIRRGAFSAGRVGELDERYFMFYEDVDWSLRAALLGERFRTVPSAEVVHFHSASTRSLGGGFKLRLIQRNLIWTAVKNLEAPAALRVLRRRSLANLRGAALGRHPLAALRAVGEAWLGLPRMLPTRRGVQRRRRVRDREVLRPLGEDVFFDSDTYQPEVSGAALLAVLERLYAQRPSAPLERLLLRLQSALATGLARDRALIAGMLRESGVELGPGLRWLLEALET